MLDIDVKSIEWKESDYWQANDCDHRRGSCKKKPHPGWLKGSNVCKRLHVRKDVFDRYASEYTEIGHGIPPFLLEDMVAYVRRRLKEDFSKIVRRRNYGQDVYEGFLSVRQIMARSGLSMAAVEGRLKNRGIKPAMRKEVFYYKEKDYERIVKKLGMGEAVRKTPRMTAVTERTLFYHVSVFKDGYWYAKASGTLTEMVAEKAWYEEMGVVAEVRPNWKRPKRKAR